jgi:transcription elongation factor Elf1
VPEEYPVYLKCRLCGHRSEVTDDWLDGHDTFTCPGCGRVFNLDDDEDDDLEIEGTSEGPEIFWYLAPMLICQCGARIELPYSNLPQTDQDGKILLRAEDPPELPSEDWTATFGCRRCGHVSIYYADDVTIAPVLKWAEGIHQSGKGVYAVRFPCGDKRCTTPVSIHVDIGDGNASEVVAALRSGIYDEQRLPCGHAIKTVPAKFYQVEPVIRRMW